MTRRRWRLVVGIVVACYAIAIVLGVTLRVPVSESESGAYRLYKDLIPLIIALPAAVLAYAFQRRTSYVQALRALWTKMVDGFAAALAYTEASPPSPEQYLDVLRKLSAAIEETRGVFSNVPAAVAPSGWYPFEPVKQIYQLVRELRPGEATNVGRLREVRHQIYEMWKRSRDRLLVEFERDEPTTHHAAYAPGGTWRGADAPKSWD